MILGIARKRRGHWAARVMAWFLAVVFVTSSVTIDPDCFSGADTEDMCPCPCPLDCASCITVRTVPPSVPAVAFLPRVPRAVGVPPPIQTPSRPVSPDPREISHVPKI